MSLLNTLVAKSMPLVPKAIVKSVAQRYIAGDSLIDAVNTVKRLALLNITSTVDVLGEFVTSRERAVHESQSSMDVLHAINEYTLPAYLSVKLTSLGLDIDDEFCYNNVRSLVAKAHEIGSFVRLDMENSPYTTRTLDIYKRIRAEGFTNIGVVIQAYMRRSYDDIESLKSYNADVRLCKGIYIEDESIAYKGKEEIQSNYKKLLRQLFQNGMPIHIATHDDVLINDALGYIQSASQSATAYEFQMLLGVREERRDEIVRMGHAMRVYVPFGEDWYGYSTRRLKENPQVAGYIFKAMFTNS